LRSALAALAILTLSGAARGRADDAPPWLRQAAATATPALEPSIEALVLADEESVLVGDDGVITTTRRRAVRILTREGRDRARGHVVYMTGTGKVKDVRGFLVWPNGDVKKYGKDRVLDVALAPQDVYNDVRARVISASEEAAPGVVFGVESVVEDKSVFTQFDWQFQDELPVALSAFSLTLPQEWGATGVFYNHAQQEPALVGRSYRWELRDLPPIKPEAAGPALTSIAPWLAVSLVPPAGAHAGIGRAFTDWPDVALWLSQLADPQAAVTPELERTTREVTRDARSEYERVRAIGRYAQAVKYVSIQTGVGRGGGYRPHPAADVLAKGYGDCKDKANLTRTLLKAAGIEAYPVAAFSGDRARVREDWPSPQQFNHAIVAVRLTEKVEAPAVEDVAGLGQVLFFDPTDEHTPVGLLPQDLEGSLGLLVSAERGRLVSLPKAAPADNRVERRLEVALSAEGGLSGKVEEIAYGHAAASYRRAQEEGAAGAYHKQMEAWIAKSGPGSRMNALTSADLPDGALQVTAEFSTPSYAKSMRGKLLVVTPRVLPGRNRVYLGDRPRKYPVVLDSEAFEEQLRMKLPDGFAVEEIPRPSQGEAAFGSHSSSCAVEGGYLSCRRRVNVSATVIPVERYGEVRDFFAWVNSEGSEPVVLSR
jgi:hypothetical protein